MKTNRFCNLFPNFSISGEYIKKDNNIKLIDIVCNADPQIDNSCIDFIPNWFFRDGKIVLELTAVDTDSSMPIRIDT